MASTKATTLIDHIGSKIFKEEPAKFVLRVFKSKFTPRKCKEGDLRIQDLLSAEDPDKLEAELQSEEDSIELTIRYEIRAANSQGESGADNQDAQSSSADDEIEIPQDLSEPELMEMLTEVMSVMLFNKDEQLSKIVGRDESLELKSKLPHPGELLGKRRRARKATE